MDLKAIKELAQKYTSQELLAFADEVEQNGTCSASAKEDCHEIMSDVLQALEVRQMIDGGMTMQEAVRAFSKRVRGVLS